MNTGHAGSLGTIHTNSTKDMAGRLEMMVRMGADLPISVIRSQIAAGIDLAVQLYRDSAGKRRVFEISEITGIVNEEVALRTLFRRNDAGELIRMGKLADTRKMEEYERIRKAKGG